MTKRLSNLDRRDFIKLGGVAAVAGATDKAFASSRRSVCVVIDEHDPLTSSAPAKWGIDQLLQALTEIFGGVVPASSLASAPLASQYIVVASASSTLAKAFAKNLPHIEGPESVSLTPGRVHGMPALLISATGARGFVYGLTEVAEHVGSSDDTGSWLKTATPVNENPANRIRSVARAFCSEVEDKPWYYDKAFWTGYLDLLAASRFNRFNFALGFGYDFPRGVKDDYFHFPYPYLVDVPGYNVRAVPLKEGERERNLAMLQFISAQTALRGIQFQLGLWTHAYAWTDSPESTHHITGLTPETHANYCRDALVMLLRVVPEIEGLTFRIHGESGIPEGSYPFWTTLFSAIPASGRKIEIDMHAKGMNQTMIDIANATGMPVKIGAKFWAEHQGLGYQQADIRAQEIPKADRKAETGFSVSTGDRLFTRYGYADMFQQGVKYEVLFRRWPGTQKHLLWGDPAAAAAYGRSSHFCNAAGIEVCEPLTFKGREGSGHAGGRCAYEDATLDPGVDDFLKFEYTYRLWGRLLYNPDADAESWRRYLRSEYGAASLQVERALANAGRVLPLLTTAHLPSASNRSFWPEIYENMPIVLGSEPTPYSDTPAPKVFGTVSPLDPQLFATVVETADDALAGKHGAKYSAIEVAQWLESYIASADSALNTARTQAGGRARSAKFRRMEEDVLIQLGLGRFFAAKLRSAMLFEIYQKTGNSHAGELALAQYQSARAAWSKMALRAKGIYKPDVSYGEIPQRRGHWMDRIPHIDADVAAMQQLLSQPKGSTQSATAAIQAVMAKFTRPTASLKHAPAEAFTPGQPLTISLSHDQGSTNIAAILHYRHVNQGERWQNTPMESQGQAFHGTISGAYTNSPYPLQYYFELRKDDAAWLHPAFNETLSNEPYYAIWKRHA